MLFGLAIAIALYVGIEQYRNNPQPTVMKWGFILVTLYMGPVGLLIYVMADKEPRPGEHEEFIKPLWSRVSGPRSIASPATRPGSSSRPPSPRSSVSRCGST